MVETYQELLEQQAHETRRKWENIITKNLPHLCKKCWEEKFPEDFVMQYIENPIAGRYRYLYECKECKKKRIYEKRWTVVQTFESALGVVYEQLQSSAKQKRVAFQLKEIDLFNIREKQKGRCYYTGYEMAYSSLPTKSAILTEKTKYQVSCDRLDNDSWYTKDNCVLCCTIVNKMKGNISEEEFYKICNDIIRNGRG